jgi:16S rRNA (guanine527-N7)-methyltransferase
MEIIKKYFPELSENQIEKFILAEKLYKFLNEKINVISRKDIDFFIERHLLHSLGIAKITILKNAKNVIDIGTGGGFPGIPLAVFYPEINFTLVDSIGKKITVVNEIIKELQLTNVKTFTCRSENLKGKFDFITSRAVTNFPDFYKNSKHLLNKSANGGIIYLKGGDFEEEISQFKQNITTYNLKNFFTEDFFETKKVIYMKTKY